MTNIKEQVTYTTRAAIYSAYPPSNKDKRKEAADLLGLKPRSFMRKLEANTDSRKQITLDQAVTLLCADHINNSHLSKVFAPAKRKVVSITSDTPLSQVLTVLTRACAAGAEALADLKLTQSEKAMLEPLIDPAESGLNALRLACAEKGVTRI